MGQFIDRTQQRFGRLIVISRDTSRPLASNGRRVYWICRCDCGVEKSIAGHELASGDSQSCGCLHRETLGALTRTHGQSHGANKSGAYSSWMAAKMRCENPMNVGYVRYGGRGIKMCKRWSENFKEFLKDMGERPIGMSLDRINSNGNYEPLNCRWATQSQQTRNKRTNRLWHGEHLCIKEIAQIEGVPRTSLNKHLKRGLSLPDAISYVRQRMK